MRERALDEEVAGRLHAGAGLARSESQFQRLLEKLPAAAYTCDPEGLITYFNRHALQLWGRAPKLNDATDRFCGSFRLFSPGGAPIPHDQCWMALALQQDKEFNGHEIVVERPDGSRLTALAHANPIRDASDQLVGAVNVLVDITDRKRAEESLRDAERHKNEFLATLSHELRNPLAPIRSAVRVLQLEGVPHRSGNGRWTSSTDRCDTWLAWSTISSTCPASPAASCGSARSGSSWRRSSRLPWKPAARSSKSAATS